jgi:hypothetical protein
MTPMGQALFVVWVIVAFCPDHRLTLVANYVLSRLPA